MGGGKERMVKTGNDRCDMYYAVQQTNSQIHRALAGIRHVRAKCKTILSNPSLLPYEMSPAIAYDLALKQV